MGGDHDDVQMVYPPEGFAEKANVKSFEEYKKMYDESINDPAAFWGRLAKRFHWEKEWESVGPEYNFVQPADGSDEPPVSCTWFKGGTTNLCYNCVDKHVKDGNGDRTAFIWEGNDLSDESRKMSYSEVLAEVQVMANVLKKLGVKKGDRVAIYMPMILELPIAMLACARIGAVHSVVFGGFAAESLQSRCLDSETALIICADGAMRGAKPIELKKVVDNAVHRCHSHGFDVPHVLTVKHVGDKCPVEWNAPRDVWYHEAREEVEKECPVEWMDAEDPLFMLYTSGSTGTPKGVLHTTGGYMVGAWATVHYIFDYQPHDVFWCTADCGWITGHTYVAYGPMLNCATQVVFEGVPTHPDFGRMWNIVDKHQVSIFYTAPTLIRALMGKGDEWVKKYKRTSLRVLGSVGEPINPEAWWWYYQVVGNKQAPIVDTWWQTETGGNMLTSLPGAIPMKPGCATLPFFGVVPAVVDVQTNEELEGEASGYLVLKKPWPSIMRTVYGNHKRFERTYFSQHKGSYFTSDGCRRDKDGYYWITGRVDDVINVSGHRIGTAEVENVFVAHPKISEAAAAAYPHHIKGEGIYVFAVPIEGVDGTPELQKELVGLVRSEIGAFAAPDIIHWAPKGVPKTRSGKIMRRILRKIAADQEDELGDISTLADPSVVQFLIDSKPKKH
ncbi:Acetyl-coenzyme A synthetase [Diplonema papillatum]|nr:Acetyl-coenzyme A synthetase [Diplonema papillatum]